MITNNEIEAIQLSATKKDYYQIWNELLDLAGKISERWDPTSTNESDPGIVLLKVLTALGDKLNYNIDVNTLEAFMPSAAQTESMRNICTMLGYNMKYFQSATTEVSIAYTGEFEQPEGENQTVTQLELPMFTTITNEDKDISYVTLEPCIFSKNNTTHKLKCIEGQIVQCETSNNNIITIDQLDDNNRFYLPEYQIAENGIFIYRIVDSIKSPKYWKKVDHLATQPYNSLVYEFGYDSREERPYIKFPDDIGQIIEDGLEIYYIRTSGLNGNIAANILTTFEKPAATEWDNIKVEEFKVKNLSATTNGVNEETITQAYENYKKTIGTFDTLVTCRDYMNKIYNLILSDGVRAVSNIVVSDIRSDINKAVSICSFNDYGITYLDTPIKDINGKDTINHFDLVLYPFTTVRDLNNISEYKKSFKYFTENNIEIEAKLADNKTISHNIKYPKPTDIVCIKNYLKLSAKITTVDRVNIIEEQLIKEAIKQNIYKTFNARKLDFGEAIPFDSILDCIDRADKRIKNIALAEPILYTVFETADGHEYSTASYEISPTSDKTKVIKTYPGKTLYNKLALRNILAGRVELFNYNKDFSFDLNESKYTATIQPDTGAVIAEEYSTIYPKVDSDDKLIKIVSHCDLPAPVTSTANPKPKKELKLKENELVKFRAPNFVTDVTYPAYVNYFIKLNADSDKVDQVAIPATFDSLYTFMTTDTVNLKLKGSTESKTVSAPEKWQNLVEHRPIEEFINITALILKPNTSADDKKAALQVQIDTYGCVIKITKSKSSNNKTYITDVDSVLTISDTDKFYYFPLNSETFGTWAIWLSSLIFRVKEGIEHKVDGLYINRGYVARDPGYLIDKNQIRYQLATIWTPCPADKTLKTYAVQHFNADPASGTERGLGQDAKYSGIAKNAEYQLKEGEFLAINYKPSAKEGQKEEDVEPINIIYQGPHKDPEDANKIIEGDIIKPNFELIDSEKYHKNSHRYAKTTGYSFPAGFNVPGMFNLSVNQQIEHRKKVEVELAGKSIYLYWTLNNPQQVYDTIFKHNIDDTSKPASYILEDDEYIYYTDKNKLDMAYYGSGTEVLFYGGINIVPNGVKLDSVTKVSPDEILANGVNSVPWIFFDFETTTAKKIVLREYQYITLAADDAVLEIEFTQPSNTIKSDTWQSVEFARYRLDGIENNLVQLTVNGLKWEVQSKLILDMSPTKAQKLYEHEKLELYFDSKPDDEPVILEPCLKSITENNPNTPNTPVPLSIKSNYKLYSLLNETLVKTYNSTVDNTLIETNDFKIKLFEEKDIGAVISDSTINPALINFHNFNDRFTSIAFAGMTPDEDYLQFYINIPANNFGLLTIYYTGTPVYAEFVESDQNKIVESSYIRVDPLISSITTLPAVAQPVIYNYWGTPAGSSQKQEIWWTKADLGISESLQATNCYLKKGINVIKIKESCILKIYPGSKKIDGVVLSDLSIIDAQNPINFNLLQYQNDNVRFFEKIDKTEIESPNLDKKEYIAWKNANEINASKYKYELYSKIDNINTNLTTFNSNYTWYEAPLISANLNKQEKTDKILAQINEMDPEHKFFYNCPLDNSIALDFNAKLLGIDDRENLASPSAWYDYNNINNNFVISEIDADDLDTGIAIARSSKKQGYNYYD